jgi:GGDEF domain-containing protein
LLLRLAFAVNVLSAALALSAAARGVALGDQLAAPMLAACVCLGVMVVGLYAKGLGWASSNLLWALTALCASAYLLIAVVLTIMRNRQRRVLLQMSRGIAKNDDVTGLPQGGTLLAKVDDALWRSIRFERECAVVAIWMENLYAFNDMLDVSVEHEIRYILTAKIRRSIGFRHVLGLGQARCFIAAMSAIHRRERVIHQYTALAAELQKPMQVGAMLGQAQTHVPKVGIGMVFVGLGHLSDPLHAMDQALALAKTAGRSALHVAFEEAQAPSTRGSQ